MQAILLLCLFLLMGNAYAENPVPLGTVSASFVLDVNTVVAAAALIAVGFSLAMFSFFIGIQALHWLREASGHSTPRSAPAAPASIPRAQQGGSGPY